MIQDIYRMAARYRVGQYLAGLALFLFYSIVFNAPAQAQVPDPPAGAKMKNSEGTDFWVCFMRNYRDGGNANDSKNSDPLTLELFITANQDANVQLEIDGIAFKRTLTVKAGTVSSVLVDDRAQLDTSRSPQRRAVHITSNSPISVYGLNRRFQTTDTYLALPIEVLGTEYRAVGYMKLSEDLVSQAAIIATEDNTEVYITPTSSTSDRHEEGKPYTVQLRKGDVYQFSARFDSFGQSDLTGTLIKSNKKIAVFSGHSCAYVPQNVQACNHLVEQLPPVSSWGKHFYVGMLKSRSRYTLRVVASEPRTKVFENTKLVSVLNAGEFYENMNVRQHLQITADKPVMVAQYSQGFRNGDSVGDPMMILVSPTQQFINRYRIATPVNGSWDHYVNLIVPTENISSMRLDGQPMQTTDFEPLGFSRYSIAQKRIDFGTHVITGDTPFGLYSYGFGYRSDAFDAYGNMGGQSFFDLEEMKDTLQPIGETKPAPNGLTLIVRDDRNIDKGLRSVSVLFAQGLTATIPKIEEGAPQVQFDIKPAKPGTDGKMVLQALDAAGNRTVLTVCYTFDNKTERYGFKLCPEGEDCDNSGTWSIGAFLSYNAVFHSADFSRSGNLVANGRFGDASGSGGYFGIMASRRINQGLALTGKLSLETIGGTLRAPDSVIARVRDGNGNLVPFQEELTMKVNAPVLSLAIAAEWYALRSTYLTGGARAMLSASNEISLTRHILQPQDRVYSETQQAEIPVEIDGLRSMTTLQVGLFGGIGVSVNLASKITGFIEAIYTHPLNSAITEGNGSWYMYRVSVNSGVRFRL